MADDNRITHVSDTALWVATYRAEETRRPDAVFRDPLAAVLTGERGRKIAAQMPYGKIMGWVLVLRTSAIDRLVLKSIENGADTVVNLGAGLDTRPYRMRLPPGLRWIEIDFPAMVQYKNQKLKSEKPICRLERIGVDLADAASRREIFARLGAASKKVTVISEGVVPYLDVEQAERLSEDLFAVPAFHYWIQDFHQGHFRRRFPKAMAKKLKDTPFRFDVKDWLGFFGKQGWKVEEKILTIDEAKRLRRPPPFIFPLSLLFMLTPKRKRREYLESTGYVLFSKT